MEETEFAAALSNEKRRIQEALISIGYFAHTVRFELGGIKFYPRLVIEAEPGDESSRRSFG
jgi:hypothetical protein